MLNQENVLKIKEKYRQGHRVKLISMIDCAPIPHGDLGTIKYVDDAGQIHVNWGCGRSLALIVGTDEFELI